MSDKNLVHEMQMMEILRASLNDGRTPEETSTAVLNAISAYEGTVIELVIHLLTFSGELLEVVAELKGGKAEDYVNDIVTSLMIMDAVGTEANPKP